MALAKLPNFKQSHAFRQNWNHTRLVTKQRQGRVTADEGCTETRLKASRLLNAQLLQRQLLFHVPSFRVFWMCLAKGPLGSFQGRPGTKSSEYSKCTCQMPNVACKDWGMHFYAILLLVNHVVLCIFNGKEYGRDWRLWHCALTEWVKFTTRESQAAAPDAVKKAGQKFILARQPVVCRANVHQVGLVGVVSWNLHWQRRHSMYLKMEALLTFDCQSSSSHARRMCLLA